MEPSQPTEETGLLNETTMTIHRNVGGISAYSSDCGHTNHLADEQLQLIDIDRATDELQATKCGGCFENAGGTERTS